MRREIVFRVLSGSSAKYPSRPAMTAFLSGMWQMFALVRLAVIANQGNFDMFLVHGEEMILAAIKEDDDAN